MIDELIDALEMDKRELERRGIGHIAATVGWAINQRNRDATRVVALRTLLESLSVRLADDPDCIERIRAALNTLEMAA